MKTYLFITLLAFAAFPVIAQTELWNGFTTDMTKEAAIARACELLGMDGPSGEDTDPFIYINIPYPGRDIWEVRFSPKSSIYSRVCLYFYNDKLFIIGIDWMADANAVLNSAIKQFGNPKTEHDTVEHDYHTWNLPGRYMILHIDHSYKRIGLSSFETSYFIDRKTYDSYLAEYNRAEEQKKAAEEDRKKAAADGITF